MKTTADHLKPAEKSLRWAEKALDQLRSGIAGYFQGNIATHVTETDLETGENVLKLKLIEPFPEGFEEFASGTLLNAKNAFDQCIHNASTALGIQLEGNNYFPWSTGPRDMEGKLRKACVPEELWDAIARQEPYKRADTHPGGDDVIRSLATLANNKHTVGLDVVGHVVAYVHPSIRGAVQSISIPSPLWDTEKAEMVLVRYRGDPKIEHDTNLAFQVVMQDPVLPGPVDAVGSLTAFLDRAKTLHKDLTTKCEVIRGS